MTYTILHCLKYERIFNFASVSTHIYAKENTHEYKCQIFLSVPYISVSDTIQGQKLHTFVKTILPDCICGPVTHENHPKG